jgi:geranylgeranyl pyrophosphate synthase
MFYDPIQYVLNLTSKKIRPLLVVLSAGATGGDTDSAYYPAAAVELLHNFTLVHDDIMDNDRTRRGKPTVHVKWDLNTAILTGDGLMGFSFQKLLQAPSGDIHRMVSRLTEAMIIICEGQGLDKMFESQDQVSAPAYLDMIDRKTAALIELSCELGALVAEADESLVTVLKEFGHALGMGFQIQDDVLDITADEGDLGKKVGSDFAMQKKTILSILLREKLGDTDFFKLDLNAYREALERTNVLRDVTKMYNNYFEKAFERLNSLPENHERQLLYNLTTFLKDRSW